MVLRIVSAAGFRTRAVEMFGRPHWRHMSKPKAPMDGSEGGGRGLPTDGLFRSTDPATSREAAEKVRPHLSELQARVLIVFCPSLEYTAEEVEDMRCFEGYKASTIRKRVSELARAGLLEETGERRDGCQVYRAKGGE